MIKNNLNKLLSFQIVTDTDIVDQGSSSLSKPSKTGQFNIYLSSELYRKMAPQAKIMAWAVSSGTFMADSAMVQLDIKLPNSVRFNN